VLGQARATALTGSTTLTVPFPTNATSLVGPLPGLTAGGVEVQVYNQTGSARYTLVETAALAVKDSRPSRVRFLNNLVFCDPDCQDFTERLAAEEGYIWLSTTGRLLRVPTRADSDTQQFPTGGNRASPSTAVNATRLSRQPTFASSA
jgi:hypothetical protein